MNSPGYDGWPQDPAKPIVVRVVSPIAGEVLMSNTADVFLQVDNYLLATGGNVLHVIHNNNPPVILDNIKRPIVLRDLAEGGHCVRVLACKPDGLAHTNKEAFAMVHFFVRKRDFQNFINPELPYLTVNTPIGGSVEPDSQGRVWLDFRAHNVTIGPGGSHVLRYECNNVQGFLNGPFFWPGMKPGRYQLKVDLLTTDLQPVPGVMNKVERVFEVRPAAVRAIPLETPAAATPTTTLPGSTTTTAPTQNKPPGAPVRPTTAPRDYLD